MQHTVVRSLDLILNPCQNDFQDEYLTTLEACYFRTEEDLAAPFEDAQSPVRNAGLRLLAMETHNIKYSWRERWMKLNKQGEITRTHSTVVVIVRE